jgi:hypothetical protein
MIAYPADREYWRNLSRVALRAPAPEFVEAVVDHLLATIEAGHQPAVWHSAAHVGGYADRCNCAMCRGRAQ